MAPSSSRIQSSNLVSLTLPFKYRRKSWSVDNSDDLSSDITTAPPPLSSAASSSSCSSSPIASSAILSSSNPGSPSEYNFARMRDHDEEAWFDTRLSVSYIPFASRVPARTEKGKYYEGGYGGQRERIYATGYEYDTAILSDDDHDLDPHDPTNDESLYSSPTRRISFTTSAERDRPYVRPTPAGTSPSPSPAPSSSFPVSCKAFSNRLRESESLPPSSPGFSTASPGLPPSSPPPSSPFAMSIASPMSSPMRSISPFVFKRSISPEKQKENRRETTPPPPKRRGRVSIESLLSPDPLPRVSVTKIEMENSEKKRISPSPTPRASSVLVTPDISSEQREVTPNLRQSPTPISAPLISDSTAPILSDLHDASCSPLDTPDLTSASTSDSSADPDSPALEISPPVPLASPVTLSCEFAEASSVSPVSSNAVSGESRDGDVVVSDVAPVPEAVPHDEDMDIVVDDTPERPSLPMSRHDSPVPSSSSTLIHELSRPSTSKSTAFSVSVPEDGDYFPRTPVKRRASTSSSFSTRHSSPALPSSPLSPVSSVFDDGDVEIEEEEEVVSKKRKGKGKVVDDEERERKRVKGEKSVRRKKSSASVVEADESDVDVRKEKREVKRKKKRVVVFSDDEEDQEEEKKPLKKRGRKPKASTEENAVASTSALTDDPEPKTKRKPGRPRKNPPPSPDPSSPSKYAHLKATGMSVLDLLPFELPLALDELQGMVIETLATSRASSLGPSVVWSSLVGTRPALKDLDVVRRVSDQVDKGEKGGEGDEMEEKMGRKEWMMLIEAVFEEGKMRCGMFGKVESSFKDDNGRPLEAQWFYVPECDPDTDRATLIRSMMPRPGKRTVTKQYKQYYWRPLGKISRWDDEDAI